MSGILLRLSLRRSLLRLLIVASARPIREGVIYSLPPFCPAAYLSAKLSATRAVPLARHGEVDRDWRRPLTGRPFRARQSSRNGPVRLGQRFSEDRPRALLVEAGDAMQVPPPLAAQPLPSERTYFRTPTRLEPRGILPESRNLPPFWPCREIFVRPRPAPSAPPELCQTRRPVRPCIDRELF